MGFASAILLSAGTTCFPNLRAAGLAEGAKLGNLGDSQVVLTRVGSFPGVRGVRGMEILDGKAHVLDATGLSVFDLADPLHPTLLGRTNLVASWIAVAPGVTAVAEGRTVRVFDTSVPTNIRGLATYAVNSGSGIFRLPNLGGVHREGNLLYLGLEGGLLEIVNVSDPTAPRMVGSHPSIFGDPNTDIGGAVTVGTTQAFTSKISVGGSIGSPSYEVHCLNKAGYVGGALPPFPLGVLNLQMPAGGPTTGNRTPTALRWRGGLLYVGASDGGFQVVSFATPATPVVHSRFATAGRCLDVALQGDSAVLASGDGGVEVLDIRNSTSIRPRGRLVLGSSVSLVRANDSMVFASGPSLGLEILQVGPATLVPVAQTLTFNLPAEINETQSIPLVASSSSGLPVQFTLVSSEVRGTVINTLPTGTTLDMRPSLESGFAGMGPRENRGPWVVRIRASQSGNAQFLPVEVEKTLLVSFATRIGLQRSQTGSNRVDVVIPAFEVVESLTGYSNSLPLYRIQFSSDMATWSDVSGPHRAGSDPVSVDLPSDRASGFLRLLKLP